MIEQFKDAMVRGGATWVLWLLVLLSILSVGVMLDRARVFWFSKHDLATLVQELHRLLGLRDLEGAKRRLESSPSAEAAVALAGLVQWERGANAAKEAMAAATGLQRARLERRLLFLGTVGNNAPFIGLLGTVIGVVGAFEELGKNNAVAAASALAPERVMSTIAEALVTTAVGLVVAIPAVAVYNHFQGRLSAVLANADTLGHVLLSHIGAVTPESVDVPTTSEVQTTAGGEHGGQ
ncbi:MAG TPA: MotA/TolQ/ExbB proton channel family protein [Labilithrix sp.]|nr:MotA/TolQ/ExbB proton channel family protein [Labilithrix sp.]